MKRIYRNLRTRWERYLFGIVGFLFLIFTFRFLLIGQVAATSATFAMAFFAFFYSNLARFKKFKGLGFEAELWEDKQKEAATLIERLKSVVTIYTRETVMNSVMRSRWGGSDSWQKRWDLFDDLRGTHGELGQNIDFSALRSDIDAVFLFDMCAPLESSVARSFDGAKDQLRAMAQQRFGNPVLDVDGFNKFYEKLKALPGLNDNAFHRAKHSNIARDTLDTVDAFKSDLKERFNIDFTITPPVIARLDAIADLADNRPFLVTPELVKWADDHNAFGSTMIGDPYSFKA